MTPDRHWVRALYKEPGTLVVIITHVAIALQFLSAYWRPDFIRDGLFALALGLFVFSFLSVHSGMFFSSLRGGAVAGRVVAAVFLIGFYSLFVLAFGLLVLRSIPLTLLFLLQLGGRAWGAVRAAPDAPHPGGGSLLATLVILVASAGVAHMAPFPATGVAPQEMDRLGGEGNLFWYPHEAILFGLLFTLGSVAFELARLRRAAMPAPASLA